MKLYNQHSKMKKNYLLIFSAGFPLNEPNELGLLHSDLTNPIPQEKNQE